MKITLFLRISARSRFLVLDAKFPSWPISTDYQGFIGVSFFELANMKTGQILAPHVKIKLEKNSGWRLVRSVHFRIDNVV